MCGIFGYNLPETSLEQKSILAAVLATKMDYRGGDSWGVQIDDRIRRGLGNMGNGISARKLGKATTLRAHTRKATTGEVTVANSHPFVNGSITGAHNGCISNHESLNTTHNRNCKVDSEHIFHHIKEDLPLSDIYGWGAVWYIMHKEPSRTYLFRSEGGELSVWGLEKRSSPKGIIFASTGSAVKQGMRLAGLQGFEYEVKPGQLYYIEDGGFYFVKDSLMQFGIPSIQTYDDYYTMRYKDYESWERDVMTRLNNDESINSGHSAGFCDGCDEVTDWYDLEEYKEWDLCPTCFRTAKVDKMLGLDHKPTMCE